MTALPAVPSTIRVQWKGTDSSDSDIISRMYFQYSGSSPTAAQLATMAATVGTSWNTNVAPMTNNGFTLTEVLIEDLNSSTGAVGTATVSHNGTNGTWSGALNSSLLINFLISRRYRGGKPRIYLPPAESSALSTGNTWNATDCTTWTGYFGSFITGIEGAVWTGGGTLTQVNVSYYHGFTVFTGPTGRARNIPTLRTTPTVDAVESISVNTRVASQRRRLGKR